MQGRGGGQGTVKVQTVWPGGVVELPDPSRDEPAFRVVTTARTSGDWRPGWGGKKPPPPWLVKYLETSRETGKL
jgi:hypothetical protein